MANTKHYFDATARGWSDSVDSQSTDKKHDLGTLRHMDGPDGSVTFVYVYNDSGSDLVFGTGCTFKAGAVDFHVTAPAAQVTHPSLVGVDQFELKNGYYGWVMQSGVGYAKAGGGGIAANASLKCVATGVFGAGTMGTDDLLARAGAAIAAGSTGLVRIFP